MWDVRRFVRLEEFPARRRVVIHFHFRDAGQRERDWWLVVEDRVADLCRDDPGHDLTLAGALDGAGAHRRVDRRRDARRRRVAAAHLHVIGPSRYAERFWHWLGRSAFAETRAATLQG